MPGDLGKEGAVCPTGVGRENQVHNPPRTRASTQLAAPESNIDPFP